MRGALLLPAAVVAAACYGPRIPAGAPCVESRECPEGQACLDGACGGGPEGGSDASPGATVLVVGEERSELRDTELAPYAPDDNKGDVDHISVETEVSLVWFDLSGVPAGATPVKATLNLHTTDDADEQGGTVLVYRMLEGWDEGAATWRAATATRQWPTPGAGPPAREDAPLVTLRPNREHAPFDVALPVEVVRGWLADPATNFGLVLVRGTSGQHVHFGSREGSRWSKLRLELRP